MSGIESVLKPDFSQASLKVRRAKIHIAEVDALETKFFSGYPHEVGLKGEFQNNRFGYVVSQRRDIPGKIGLAIGDAIHNLRTALDYLVTACAIAHGKTIGDTKFPFTKSKETLASRLKDDVRKAGAIAQQIVSDLKPYPGGNDALVELHELDLIDKHRLIVATACITEIAIVVGQFSGKPAAVINGRFDFSSREPQFVAAPAGYEFDIPTEMRFSGEIVFGCETPKRGKPCVAALNEFVDVVSEIIATFERAFT